jgi:hypothetical protein
MEVKQDDTRTAPHNLQIDTEHAPATNEESIVVKEGKGLIKGKHLVYVDGDSAPGGPWDTAEQAQLAVRLLQECKVV